RGLGSSDHQTSQSPSASPCIRAWLRCRTGMSYVLAHEKPRTSRRNFLSERESSGSTPRACASTACAQRARPAKTDGGDRRSSRPSLGRRRSCRLLLFLPVDACLDSPSAGFQEIRDLLVAVAGSMERRQRVGVG